MKRILWLLMVVFVISGCGGGSSGGIATSSGSDGSSGGNSATSSSFTISLAKATSNNSAKMLAANNTSATRARVIVRQFNTIHHHEIALDESDNQIIERDKLGNPIRDAQGNVIYVYEDYDTYTETYRRVVSDLTIAANNTVTFSTPISTQDTDVYEFVILTYVPGTGTQPNTIVQYGTVNNVIVAVNGSATITLKTIDQAVTATLPAFSIKSEQSFNFSFRVIDLFRPAYSVTASTPSNKSVSILNCQAEYEKTIIAPSTSDTRDTLLNFTATFYLGDSLLNKADSSDVYTKWAGVLNYPLDFAYLVQVTL